MALISRAKVLIINYYIRSHAELTTISNEMIIGELKWTETAIKEVLGVTPRLMRPVSPTYIFLVKQQPLIKLILHYSLAVTLMIVFVTL